MVFSRWSERKARGNALPIDEVQRSDFALEQVRMLRALAGKDVVEANVREMGLYGPDEAPSFDHPDLKFVQAHVLEIVMSNDTVVHVSNDLDDDFFFKFEEVSSEKVLRLGSELSNSLFRYRPLTEMHVGKIDAVDWDVDERGNVQKATLRINDNNVVLMAGEVDESFDGNLTVRDRDESVLIFFNVEDFNETKFNIPAYRAV